MKRFLRIAVLVALVGGLAVVASPQANAVNSPVFEFVVPCNDSNGVNSNEYGIDMPNGTYLVTAVGACTVAATSTGSIQVGTPCTVPVTGTPIPCVPPITALANVPGAACVVATSGVQVTPCQEWSHDLVEVPGCDLAIRVNGTCLLAGTAGLVNHSGYGMTAAFYDSNHTDNIGYFLVTAVWTPL